MSNSKLSRHNNSFDLFRYVPTEILNEILEYLDNATFVVLRFVSHRWKSITSGRNVGCNVIVYGTKYNSIEFVRWGISIRHPYTPKSFKAAIQNGSVEIVECLFSEFNIQTTSTYYCIKAAEYGRLEILKYLCRRGFELHSIYASIKATINGHLDILKWIKSYSCKNIITHSVAAVAATEGHLEILKWLRANGYLFDIIVSSAAAGRGHLAVLKWLWDNELFHYDGTLTNVVSDGNAEVVEWLRTKEYAFTISTCDAAAARGDLNCLQWLHRNKCPWHSYTCTLAAGGGHLNVLIWLIMNGCPYNGYVATTAAYNGHLLIVQWFCGRILLGHPSSAIFRAAVRGGQISVSQWLHMYKCPWDERVTTIAAENGHWKLAQWLIDEGCPCNQHTRSAIAAKNTIAVCLDD